MNSESDTAAVYRVSFMGSELTEIAMAGLIAAGAAWEGSENGPDGPLRHRVRVSAIDERHAIAAVCTALGAYVAFGAYTAFTASPVRNSRGEVWRGRVAPAWADIDWHADPGRARLTDEQRALIGCLLDDAEPTWMIAVRSQRFFGPAQGRVSARRAGRRGAGLQRAFGGIRAGH